MPNSNDGFEKAMEKLNTMFQTSKESWDEYLKKSRDLNEQYANIVLDAARDSSTLAATWSEETITQLAELSKADHQMPPSTEEMQAFTAAQATATLERMKAFAEIAQKVQNQTAELFAESTREFLEEAAKSKG